MTIAPGAPTPSTTVEAARRAGDRPNGAAAHAEPPPALVELREVSKRYGRLYALRNVDLSIAPGEFVFVIGPSEAGKSTLLKLMHGDLRASGGRVRVFDYRLYRRWRRFLPRLRRQVAAVFQEHRLLPHMTARGNVAFALQVADLWLPRSKVRAAAQARLDEVGLGRRPGAYPHQLSGGQQRRLAIARALGHDPVLLLADEPTANLDRRNAERVVELLERCCLAGATVVVATHDLDLASSRPHRVVELRQGRIVSDRPARAVIPPDAALARLAALRARTAPGLGERVGRVSRLVLGYAPPPRRPARPSRPRLRLRERAGAAARLALGHVTPPPPSPARWSRPSGAWRPPAAVLARQANGANGHANGHHGAGGNGSDHTGRRPYVAEAPAPETVAVWRPTGGGTVALAASARRPGMATGPASPWRRRGPLQRVARTLRRTLHLPAPSRPAAPERPRLSLGARIGKVSQLVLGYTPPPPRPRRAGPVSRWRRPWVPALNLWRLAVGGATVSWLRNLGTAAPALGSITLLLLLTGVLSVAGVGVHSLLVSQEAEASSLRVYLSDGATSDDVDQTRSGLASTPHVRAVRYVDKDQALADARHRPGLSDLATASATNPFPASFLVQVDQPSSLSEVSKAAAEQPGVDTHRPTSYDADTYQRLRQFTLVASAVAGGFGVLLFVITYVISSNAIRAAVLARRDELVTMRLVGASNWLLRSRLGVEGALTGILAGVLAGAAVVGLCLAASTGARRLFVQLLPGVTVSVAADVVAGLVLAGLVLGAVPALFALRRLRT